MTPPTGPRLPSLDSTTLSRASVLVRLADTTMHLASLHREIANMRRGELAARSRSWQASTERSASGREDEAKYSAAFITVDILSLCGERDALQVESDFLKQYLHHTADLG
jgi:hypothetical protein